MSMELLGFANRSSVWSDTPSPPVVGKRGRHEAPQAEPDTVAELDPGEFVDRLAGRNFRWSILIVSLLMVAALGGGAYWIHQRPAIQATASLATVEQDAVDLRDSLPALESFNSSLLRGDEQLTLDLSDVASAARSLFDSAGGLSESDAGLRLASSSAASATLDGIRLAGDANSYRLAVSPILAPPLLETDPELIELDQAARDFGSWQLRFDEVRTALPDGVLSATTQEMDILSGDLAGFLTSYMDALRTDDSATAHRIVDDLAGRLDDVGQQLTASLTEVQTRVTERVAEARQALERILD